MKPSANPLEPRHQHPARSKAEPGTQAEGNRQQCVRHRYEPRSPRSGRRPVTIAQQSLRAAFGTRRPPKVRETPTRLPGSPTHTIPRRRSPGCPASTLPNADGRPQRCSGRRGGVAIATVDIRDAQASGPAAMSSTTAVESGGPRFRAATRFSASPTSLPQSAEWEPGASPMALRQCPEARRPRCPRRAERFSGTNCEECLNREVIREYPRLSAVRDAFRQHHECPANLPFLAPGIAAERPDRTQEVAGSSPASSISKMRCTAAPFCLG